MFAFKEDKFSIWVWLTLVQLLFLQSDGGYDIHKQLSLSGEPLIAPLRGIFKLEPPFSAIKCQELAIQGRNSCEAYSDYWNRMAEDDGTTTQYWFPLAMC